MRDTEQTPAPNYTNASLIMGMANLLWIFGVIWAVYGLPTVVLCALALNWAIDRLGRRKG